MLRTRASLDPSRSSAPWRIYNIGNNTTVEVSRVVELLEHELGRKAKTELVPMQPGDVPETHANVDDLMRDAGFRPSTPIEERGSSIHRVVSGLSQTISGHPAGDEN